MVINLEGYKIKGSEGINSFDLYEVKEVKNGNNKGLFVDTSFAYGASFSRCIQIIIQERTKVELKELELKEFVEAYERISNRTLEELKKVFENKSK
jgi:hypothetical protein